MHFAQADAARLPFADGVFDLTFTSPPYLSARSYGIGAQRDCGQWIAWMLDVVAECVRVTKGLVLVNCAGVTRDWCYQPGPEGLLYEHWKRGGRCWRSAYWHRVGIPGSGGKQWLRADVEYVLAFTSCRGAIPWSDNTANGHPPKWAPGGEMSCRVADGARINEWGQYEASNSGSRKKDGDGRNDVKHSRDKYGNTTEEGRTGGEGKDANGKRKKRARRCTRGTRGKSEGDTTQETMYAPPVLANPGNLVKGIKVGGGLMGHPLAHENEAPFPQKLAEWFIRGWCPPGGIVLDPFSGSGTTVAAAASLGRRGVGTDIRMSQCVLGRRRCSEVQTELF
jgi:hypothetical protein